MEKLKILFVLPGYSLGGTTSSMLSLLKSKFVEQYDVEVFAINKRNYNPDPMPFFDIGMNGLTTAFNSDFSTFSTVEKLRYLPIKLLKQIPALRERLIKWVAKRAIKKIERRKNYDFIVAFQEGNTTKFTTYFTNPNKIAWIHCDYTQSMGANVNELDLYNKYKRIVCVSDFTRKRFLGCYPSLEERTISIHNLFDAEQALKKASMNIEDARYNTSHFTILSVGRISEVKQFYLIPAIAAKMKEAGIAFRWYIMGGGNNENDLRRVVEAIAQHNVENEVIYLGGKANPYPYLKNADLLVSTSKSEACPMIFNEAKLLHLPILSADFGSANEFIENGKTGWICPIKDMPNRISDIICNQDEYLSVKNNLKDFSFDNDKLLRLIDSLLR